MLGRAGRLISVIGAARRVPLGLRLLSPLLLPLDLLLRGQVLLVLGVSCAIVLSALHSNTSSSSSGGFDSIFGLIFL